VRGEVTGIGDQAQGCTSRGLDRFELAAVADLEVALPLLPERDEVFAVHVVRVLVYQVRDDVVGVFLHHRRETAFPVFFFKEIDEEPAVQVRRMARGPGPGEMRGGRYRHESVLREGRAHHHVGIGAVVPAGCERRARHAAGLVIDRVSLEHPHWQKHVRKTHPAQRVTRDGRQSADRVQIERVGVFVSEEKPLPVIVV